MPPAAVYMRPHQEGSVIRGQVWESPLLVSGLSCDSGQPKTLFHLMRSSLCMCVVGAQREKIRILTAVLQLSRLTSKDLLCPRKSIEEEEEERTGVRHGSFSGKVISSVDSQSVLPELPFSGLANHVRLWSAPLTRSCCLGHRMRLMEADTGQLGSQTAQPKEGLYALQ